MSGAPENPVAGGCLCGGVRYRIDVVPTKAAYCHCRMCQRATGAALVAWVSAPESAFRVTQGALKEHRSSERATRGFCPDCGTQITFRHDAYRDLIDVTTATLDTPDAFPPTYQIHVESRPGFLKGFDASLPVRAYDPEG